MTARRALYAHVEQLARVRRDVCGLRLYVERGNRSAKRTYRWLGMAKPHYEVFEVDFVLRSAPVHAAARS